MAFKRTYFQVYPKKGYSEYLGCVSKELKPLVCQIEGRGVKTWKFFFLKLKCLLNSYVPPIAFYCLKFTSCYANFDEMFPLFEMQNNNHIVAIAFQMCFPNNTYHFE